MHINKFCYQFLDQHSNAEKYLQSDIIYWDDGYFHLVSESYKHWSSEIVQAISTIVNRCLQRP